MPNKTLFLIGAGAAAVVLALLYKNRGLFDPSSPSNLAYAASSGVVFDVTGGASSGGEDTLGGLAARFREWVSGDDFAIREMLRGAPPRDQSASIGNVTGEEPGYGYMEVSP